MKTKRFQECENSNAIAIWRKLRRGAVVALEGVEDLFPHTSGNVRVWGGKEISLEILPLLRKRLSQGITQTGGRISPRGEYLRKSFCAEIEIFISGDR